MIDWSGFDSSQEGKFIIGIAALIVFVVAIVLPAPWTKPARGNPEVATRTKHVR